MGTDRYLRYTELTELLNELAATHPGVMRLQSLGHSHEGRDIWLATLTRFATGAAEDKPALWVDANIHSAELVGSRSQPRVRSERQCMRGSRFSRSHRPNRVA